METSIGSIDDCSGKGTYWRLQNAKVVALGYRCAVFMETKGEPPSEKHIKAVECWLNMGIDKARWIAQEMKNKFNTYISNNYDLKKLNKEDEIWSQIDGINAIHVQENGNVDFEFSPIFDRDHDFVVRIRNDAFYEVMLDG